MRIYKNNYLILDALFKRKYIEYKKYKMNIYEEIENPHIIHTHTEEEKDIGKRFQLAEIEAF